MNQSLIFALAVFSLVGADVGPGRAHEVREGVAAADSAEASLYDPPPPGTYELPAIDRVGEHHLLGPDGRPAPLLGLSPGEAAIVSFIYRSCNDATGCPLALSVMKRLDASLARNASLSRRVRLVTVSFDPVHDTPARMKVLLGHMEPKCDWRFLTAVNNASLKPVLEDFGQTAIPVVTEEGEETGQFRHVMKVYLVDGQGDVRNIYSAGLFDERLLLNDVQTVLGMASRKDSDFTPLHPRERPGG